MSTSEYIALAAVLITSAGMILGLGKTLQEVKESRKENRTTREELKEDIASCETRTNARLDEAKKHVEALAKDVRDVMLAQAESKGSAASHVNVREIARPRR